MAPKHFLFLIPRTCGYGGLYGRRDFADIIRVKTFRWRYSLGLSRWTQCSHRVIIKEKRQQENWRQGDVIDDGSIERERMRKRGREREKEREVLHCWL